MKILSLLFLTVFAFAPLLHAQETAAKIAKIDYSEIDDLLELVVLARPENKNLSERYIEQQKKQKEAQEKMQEAIMSGEKINPMEAASGMMHSRADRKKVGLLCDKLVLELIEKVVADKYQIVLKSDYRSSLLYSKVEIDDITNLIRQELLRQLPEKS